jgi:serine/threonine protein kinase
MAQNALMYGYAGNSAVTPHVQLAMSWWNEERIESTVTRDYVLSKLRFDDTGLQRLDQPVAFGDGLTDDTYIEWILEKSKRIFLILVDIGVADQIFGVIDDSWDDDDLPVPLDAIERLKLSYDRDEGLERRFYKRQFSYLLRELDQGTHTDYDIDEVVPVEPVLRRAGVTFQHAVEKVHLPYKDNEVFLRKRFVFGQGQNKVPEEEFINEIAAMKSVVHAHIASIWSSYTYDHCGYVLLTPASELNLKNFIQTPPQAFRILVKQDRRRLLVNWLHCLADALTFLYRQGFNHKDIKPSSVLVDGDNNILFADIGNFRRMEDKKPSEMESYEYGAPERFIRSAESTIDSYNSSASLSKVLHSGRNVRKISNPASMSTYSASISDTSSMSQASHNSVAMSPILSSNSTHSSNESLSSRPTSPTTPATAVSGTFSFTSATSVPASAYSTTTASPQKGDVFSLACIFLDILTLLLKRKASAFSSHRSSKNKRAGRGGAVADSSFHANLSQVESWMRALEKDASKKKDDRIFSTIAPILSVCRIMLERNPEQRPDAWQVENEMYKILAETMAPDGRKPHCGVHLLSSDGIGDVGVLSSLASALPAITPPVEPMYNHFASDRTTPLPGNFTPSLLSRAESRAGDNASVYTNSTSSSGGTRKTSTWTMRSSGNGSKDGRSKSGADEAKDAKKEAKRNERMVREQRERERREARMRPQASQGGPNSKRWEAPCYADMSFGVAY